MVYSSIVIEKNLIIRSGAEATLLKFKILPVESKQGFWINATSGITVNVKQSDYTQNERILSVTGFNNEKMSKEEKIIITLDDGSTEECSITVLPEMETPPGYAKMPEIIFKDGKAIIDYELSELGENEDQSEISWYRVDNKNRSNYELTSLSRRSNETDGRKIAVSRWDKPCREIRLTTADIGKHLKVNIKTKHSNSEIGQGENIISRVVRTTDVNMESIILESETVVTDNDYDMEPGYFSVRGDLESVGSLGIYGTSGLLTKSMGCGIYYMKEDCIDDMSLVAIIEPECMTGNGFDAPYQYADIYIKYNPEVQSGYALRIESTAAEDGMVKFCLYQIKNGNGTPISDEYLSDAFKAGCEIELQVRDDILNAFISYDDGEDFSDVEIRGKIRTNDFGGFGFKYMAEPEEGYRCNIKYIEAFYSSESHKM